jgi:hypothetical protein
MHADIIDADVGRGIGLIAMDDKAGYTGFDQTHRYANTLLVPVDAVGQNSGECGIVGHGLILRCLRNGKMGTNSRPITAAMTVFMMAPKAWRCAHNASGLRWA